MPDVAPAPTQANDATADASDGGSAAPGGIDVQKLADKVYRLMLADVRRDRRPDRRPFITRPRED